MLPFFQQLLSTYGYWIVALGVMAESMGLPFPGETLLLLGGASAGAGYLEIWGVIGAAAGGGPSWVIPSAMSSGGGAGDPSWSATGT